MPRPEAKQIRAGTANFDHVLASTENDVQKALDRLDDAPLLALMAGRKKTITDAYLRGTGDLVMNLAGYVLSHNMTIVGIGVATDGVETWTAEVRKNGSATVIASLALAAVAKAFDGTLAVDVTAGDELQFYVNGTNIEKPQMVVYLIGR